MPRRAALLLAAGLSLSACAQPQPGLELAVPSDGGSATPVGPRAGVLEGMSGDHRAGRITGLSGHCIAPQGHRTSAEEMNALIHLLDLPSWRAADVGASTRLTDGRVMWVFGDTLRSSRYSPRVTSNSVLVSSDKCFQQLMVDGSGPVIGVRRSEQACWPTAVAGVRRQGGDTVLVVCSRVVQQPEGLLGFRYVGASLATFEVPAGGVPRLAEVREITPDEDDPNQVNWGASLLVHDRFVYVYGTRQPEGSHAKEVLVARTPLSTPLIQGSWEYWDGSRWQPDGGRADRVLSADPGVSQAFSVCPRQSGGEGFALTSKAGGEFGDDIGSWVASRAQGPWRLEHRTRYPYRSGRDHVVYQPLAHPELATSSGRLLVSLSRNPHRFQDLVDSPVEARPVFLEVPQP